MNLPSQLLALIMLLALTWVASCAYHTRDRPDPGTRHVQADRPLAREDTVDLTRYAPDIQITYAPEPDVVQVCDPDTVPVPYYVPRSFKMGGFIPPEPVRSRGREVVFSYLPVTADSQDVRWVQEVYRIPDPTWSLTATVYGGTDLVRLADNAVLSARLTGRWRWLRAYVEPRADLGGSLAEGRLTVGLGVDLIRWSR
ncbi:MAG: hypothetical protein GVY18_05155 [Bacteroidetes bacterium]|jgi:hypothetical protein|nr:hypothetical protein [Bacteroidota bacterium]